MSDTLRSRISSALAALRVTCLEKRDHIETCRGQTRNLYQRPEHWFHSQEAQLRELECARDEFEFIAAHWPEYAAWRESVGKTA